MRSSEADYWRTLHRLGQERHAETIAELLAMLHIARAGSPGPVPVIDGPLRRLEDHGRLQRVLAGCTEQGLAADLIDIATIALGPRGRGSRLSMVLAFDEGAVALPAAEALRLCAHALLTAAAEIGPRPRNVVRLSLRSRAGLLRLEVATRCIADSIDALAATAAAMALDEMVRHAGGRLAVSQARGRWTARMGLPAG